VASRNSNAVAVFDRNDPAGTLTQRAGAAGCLSESLVGSGCSDAFALDGAFRLALSPDGTSGYVASPGSDAISVFDRETDTSAPDTQIDSGPTGTIKTNQATFTFSGTPASDTAKIQCRIDSEPFTDCTSPMTFTGLSDGPHTAEFRAEDAAGNQDQSPATATFTVDTTPPAGKPRLAKPKIKPKSKKVRRGKKTAFKVRVKNTGDATAKNLKVCAKGPKKLVKVPKCAKPGNLAAGRSKTVKFKVNVKKRAKKGKKAKITFTAYAKGAKKKSGKATVKIR
jgi:hypothetical protein